MTDNLFQNNSKEFTEKLYTVLRNEVWRKPTTYFQLEEAGSLELVFPYLSNLFNDYGFSEEWKAGSSRIVLHDFNSNIVLKIPYREEISDDSAASSEKALLNNIPQEFHKLFPKTLFLKGGVILQDYYAPNIDKYVFCADELESLFDSFGLWDAASENTGWRGDNFVMFDFEHYKSYFNLFKREDWAADTRRRLSLVEEKMKSFVQPLPAKLIR